MSQQVSEDECVKLSRSCSLPPSNPISSSVDFSSLLTRAGVKNSMGKIADHQLHKKDNVFISYGCLNELPPIEWLKQLEFIVLHFWR